MAFTFDLNLALTSFADAVFRIKTQLKAASWVHQASGDGLSAFSITPGNGNDQITSAGTGAGGMSNSRAWFVLKQPGETRELCFQGAPGGGGAVNIDWTHISPTTPPSARAYAAMAYHPPSGKIILFGGTPTGAPNSSNGFGTEPFSNQTWSFDTTTSQWTQLSPATTPTGRGGHAMVYSQNLGKIVMFGGSNLNVGNYNNQTYTWDGTNWALLSPGASPSPRRSMALAIDPATGNVLLFGGRDADYPGQPLSDTWIFDGTTWTQLTPATTPNGREGHGMCYHGGSNKVVMFSGGNAWQNLWETDTWTWDGTNWTLESPATSPNPRYFGGMTNTIGLAGGVVLVSGYENALAPPNFDTNQFTSDAWSWDGTTWTYLDVAYPPDPRSVPAIAYDTVTKKLVIFGGDGNGPAANDTWVAVGGGGGGTFSWYVKYSRVAGFTGGTPSAIQVPSATDEEAICGSGPDATPTFAALDEFLGGAFVYNIVTDNVPPHGFWAGGYGSAQPTWNGPFSTFFQNEEAVMAYDSTRGLSYMQGGSGSGQGPFNQTMVWNGSFWNTVSTSNLPPNARNSGMCYDPVRDRIWWWGGDYGSIISPATWYFDCATPNWFSIGATTPPSRTNHCMQYDTVRNKVVLFGGRHFTSPSDIPPSSNIDMNDTWEFDPATQIWTQMSPVTSPPVRESASMAFDSVRNVMVLFGGTNNYPPSPQAFYSDTWTWDGTNWTQHFPAHNPRKKQSASMAFDTVNGVIRLVGGLSYPEELTPWLRHEDWAWDGTDWTFVADVSYGQPPVSTAFSSNMMVYDVSRSQLVAVNINNFSYEPRGGGTWTSGLVAGASNGFIILDPISNPLAEDGDPCVLLTQKDRTTDDFVRGNLFDVNVAPAAGFQPYGGNREAFGPMFLAAYGSSGWGRVIPNGPIVQNFIDGDMELLPAWWYCSGSATAYGLKGKSSLALLPAQVQPISPFTLASMAYIAFGNIIALPWDGATTPTNGGGDFDARVINVTTPDQVTELVDDIQTQQLLAGGSGPPPPPSGLTYRMRAFDQTLGRIVFWPSDTIDTSGTDYTGPGPLIRVVIQDLIGETNTITVLGIEAMPEIWAQENVAASQTNVPLSAQVSTSFDTIKMIRAGSIVGLGTRLTEAVAAGTATVSITKNGVAGTLSIVHSTSSLGSALTQAAGIDTYVAGDLIGIQITTSAGFLPNTTYLEAWLEVLEAP